MTRTARALVPASGLALLALLLLLASQGPLYGGVAVALALLVAALLAFGAERLGTLALIAAVFTAPMNSVRPSSSASFVTFSDLFFVIGFGLLIPRLLRGRLVLPRTYVVGAMVLLVAGLLASVTNAAHPSMSLNLMSRLVVASMGLPVAFVLWAPSARMIDVLAASYVAGQVVSTGAALVNGTIDNNRYEGLTIHPNFFGMCAITAIGLLLHLRHRVPRGWQWTLWIALGANLAGTVMSGSREAVVLAVLLAVLYPVIERSALTAYAVLALGVTAVLLSNKILSLAGQGSALQRLNGDATASTSDSVRAHALDSGLSALQAHPLLGNGFENALAAHNIYLQIAESAGIIGLIGFLLMFFAIIAPLFQRGPMHRLGYGALAYAIGGVLTASLWDRMVWAGLSLAFLATLWPAGSEEPAATAAEPDPAPPPRAGTPALARLG